MRIAPDDHPFPIFDRDGGVRRPPRQITGSLNVPLKEDFQIFDPLLKKEIFILVFEKKKGFPLSN